jgi:anti-sigma factor RsiW
VTEPASHPNLPDETLAAYVLGDLSAPERSRVEAVLAVSEPARAKVSALRAAAETLERGTLEDPPMPALQRALRLVVQAPRAASWLARAADAVATLLFDSLATPTPVGLRSGGVAEARHLTFDSALGEVDIEVRPAGPGRVQVVGQIAREDLDGVEVGFVRPAAGEEGTAEVDGAGRFSFRVAKGELEVRFHVGGRVLVLPRIQAG